MTVFKDGDRVRYISTGGFFGREGVITRARLVNQCVEVRFSSPHHLGHWNGPEYGGFLCHRFELCQPLSPFDEAVRDYINQELSQ